MDFFALQRSRASRSRWLLASFALALAAVGAIIYLIVGTLAWLLGETADPLQPSVPAIAFIGIIWLAMLFGAAFRLLEVRAGGACLAKRFGATRVVEGSANPQERTLLHVVAEMAVASSSSMPDVFVLNHERALNALVVGSDGGRPAIIITRGALDAFDRDQLKGVIAHEFGHLSNGDLALNMRLLIVLGGLLAVDEIGPSADRRHARRVQSPGCTGWLSAADPRQHRVAGG